jgi:mannitol-1-phosphate/altronate dehydrogenase
LVPVAPGFPRAILVEEFNRILISRIRLPNYRRGIEVFVEKENLLPFEEVKFHGHNAIHAWIAYLADLKGYEVMSQAGDDEWIMSAARRTLIEESGKALIRAKEGFSDPLFTLDGYTEFADDLLRRIVNPNLNDLVKRVGRDHPRKLGIQDRLYGTMILALEQGVEPRNLGIGAAAGVLSMIKSRESLTREFSHLPESADGLSTEALTQLLYELWGDHASVKKHGSRLVELTRGGLEELRRLGIA